MRETNAMIGMDKLSKKRYNIRTTKRMESEKLMPFIIAGVAFLLVLLAIALGYKKAPPDTAFIVSGLRKKTVIGKAAICIPFLERMDRLSLKLVPVDVKTSSAVPTADYINISVDAVVNVKVSDREDLIKLAAQNFLNQSPEYIGAVAREVLEGNMREIVGKMKLAEMVSDRQKFAELVRANAEPDLAAMGLAIVAFNVQTFRDENGVIEDLGIDNISQIKKNAAIAKAQADQEIAVAKAEAEKRANEARVNSEREIARKNNELALEKAALKEREDTARARADAAYRIQSEEQRKVIDVTSAEADIAAQTKQVELKAREADVAEQELNARIKKQADANLYQRQQEAEAKKFEMQRAAEAEKYKREQEAEGIRLVGQAEADAIRQKGLAEAETMAKKAIAYQEYTGAAVAEMLINVLPQVAERIAQPLAAIDKVTIIGGGEGAGSGVGSVADGVPLVMGKLFASMKEATGIDLSEIVRAESYDAKVKKEISVNGALPVTMAQNSAQEGEQLETHVEDATVQQD